VIGLALTFSIAGGLGMRPLADATAPDGLYHWALVNGQVVEWFGPSPHPL
jgi:hypothetical protein